MDNRSPAFQFYPAKWQAHTFHLSDFEYRVYHEMLCWMWLHSETGFTMPVDPQFIATALRMECDRIALALSRIQLPGFALLKEEGMTYVSHGLRKVMEGQNKHRQQRQEAANSRWSKEKGKVMRPHKSRIAKAHATLPVSQCSSSSSVKYKKEPPISPHDHKVIEPEPKGDAEWFAEFWKEWPIKKKRLEAVKAWNKLPMTIELAQKIVDAVVIQAQTAKWKKGFIPNAPTWLNGHQWNDEVEQTEIPETY